MARVIAIIEYPGTDFYPRVKYFPPGTTVERAKEILMEEFDNHPMLVRRYVEIIEVASSTAFEHRKEAEND